MAKASGSDRLNKYGDFGLIDDLVKSYNGAYTHDQLFDLDVIMVHNMILYAKESAYVNAATQEAHKAANKAKK